jgi:hypothetical protein
MTPEERKQQALAIISKTLKMLGCDLAVQYQTEQLGAVLQVRSQIIVVTKPDWTPPTETPTAALPVDSEQG